MQECMSDEILAQLRTLMAEQEPAPEVKDLKDPLKMYNAFSYVCPGRDSPDCPYAQAKRDKGGVGATATLLECEECIRKVIEAGGQHIVAGAVVEPKACDSEEEYGTI